MFRIQPSRWPNFGFPSLKRRLRRWLGKQDGQEVRPLPAILRNRPRQGSPRVRASTLVAPNLLQDTWIETIRAGSADCACSTPAKRRMPKAWGGISISPSRGGAGLAGPVERARRTTPTVSRQPCLRDLPNNIQAATDQALCSLFRNL